MKILVLNGSPKGMQSVTMLHVQFLQKKFPQHQFEFQNISQRIKRLENNREAFDEVIAAVHSADGLLWATPVYYFTIPGQYKRFIELVFERQAQGAFQGKYAASLTTSIHFFDHTSNNYLQAVCEDLGMKFYNAYPAHMQEMMGENGRRNLVQFCEHFLDAIESERPIWKHYVPLQHHTIAYRPAEAVEKIDAGGRNVLLLHDALPEDQNLLRMVERFQASFAHPIETINLRDLDIKGGCLGCLHCGYENICTYSDKDDFTRFYEDKVCKADLLVIAGRIHDRYLSALWKTVFDRSFFRGHAPSLIGTQLAYLVSGPLSQNDNLRQVLQAYAMMQRCSLAGMVSDEVTASADLDVLIQNLAADMVNFSGQEYSSPDNFLFLGGKKIFRDDIYGDLRTVFQADHRLYQQLGYYDFPTKNIQQRLLNGIFGLLFKHPSILRGFQRMIKTGMLRGLKKVLEHA